LSTWVESAGLGSRTLTLFDGAANRGGLRVGVGHDHRVLDRVHQTGAEQRRGQTADVVHGRIRGLDLERRGAGLAARAGERADRHELAQRSPLVREAVEDPVVEPAEPALDLDAGAADRALGVAVAAGPLVEDRAEPSSSASTVWKCVFAVAKFAAVIPGSGSPATTAGVSPCSEDENATGSSSLAISVHPAPIPPAMSTPLHIANTPVRCPTLKRLLI